SPDSTRRVSPYSRRSTTWRRRKSIRTNRRAGRPARSPATGAGYIDPLWSPWSLRFFSLTLCRCGLDSIRFATTKPDAEEDSSRTETISPQDVTTYRLAERRLGWRLKYFAI